MTKRLTLCALAAVALASIATEAQRPATHAPTPASVIGFIPCDDYTLATYEQIAEYFRALDASSERIQLVDIGQTVEGRTQLMAIISSETNMQRLDRLKAISRRLALARNLTDEQARELASEGRSVVWIDFGLHSTEVAHAQTAPLMAYRAVTDDSDEMQAIRENVIFLLVPNMNPDGTTLVADWYMRHVSTPFEHTSPPELYQKYAGHDNNRDWFMFNLAESRNVATQLYEEWFPQIVYNQHQSAPFPARIFVPPFADPMNPNIPPLVMRIDAPICQDGRSGGFTELLARAEVSHDALIDFPSEKAFTASDDVAFRPSIRPASDDRVDRRLVIAHTDHDGSMEGGVRLSVAAPIEAVSTGGHPGGGGDGTRAAELGKGGCRANPLRVIPEHRGGGVGANGEALPEGGRRLGGESGEV